MERPPAQARPDLPPSATADARPDATAGWSWLEAVAGTALRMTGPRRLVAELIAPRTSGFTAADLLAEPRARRRRLGRATVFRTLDRLHGLGLLERLEMPDGEHTYVRCEPVHHHHVICSACGQATEVEACAMASFAERIASTSGYRVDRHRVEFYGLCPACQARPAGRPGDPQRGHLTA